MAEKLMKRKAKKVSPKKPPLKEAKKTVLVGTYKGKQLDQWPGYYNYPISAKDKIDEAAARKVNELWLFQGAKEGRFFSAEYVGKFTREDLKSKFKYPARGKAHGSKYLLYKITKRDIYDPATGLAEAVIVRAKDFRTAKVTARRIKAYLESPDRKDPVTAKLVPSILTKIPRSVLRVCEAAVQMDFFYKLCPPIYACEIAHRSCHAPNRSVISMFSGAMGLDNGIEKAGLDIRLCVEIQHAMAETIRANKPDVPLIEDDVRNYSGAELREMAGIARSEDVFLVCGGPPCQAFSTAGKRLGFDDDRGNVFLKYIDLIGEIRPRYFLLENVRGLLSAGYDPDSHDGSKPKKGTALVYALGRIHDIGYSATFTLYDSANYGVPQRRERVIILGSRDGFKIPLIPPTHSESGGGGLKRWRTFKEAVAGLRRCTSIPIPAKRLKYFRMLKPGQYWKDLPAEMQKTAMGKSYDLPGGKTGFYRRLSWDLPSPTLVTCPTMPATDLMHPVEDRALSLEEYARIQMFPDDWVFKGSVSEIYKQIGNAVPVGMGYAAARHLLWFDSLTEEEKKNVRIVDPKAVYSRYRNTSYEYFDRFQTDIERRC